jgi:antitoxin YefM
MADAEIQFVSDERGETTAVIVPISLWREIESERETRYLLRSEVMKRRLLEAKDRQEGIPVEAAIEKLGL